MTDHIRLVPRDGYLEIAFARPEKKNALTSAMFRAMVTAMANAAADDAIACVLFTGEGDAFCAGNDIGDFVSGPEGAAAAMAFVRALAQFDKPILAAVQGQAVGIGSTMLLHCDLVYAAPDARFAMPFVKLGLVPEAGSSLLAPSVMGRTRAAEMLLLGEAIDAAEAERAGLILGIVGNDALADHARSKAATLAHLPRAALLDTRRLLQPPLAETMARIDAEADLFAAALSSTEAQAAFAQFLKR